MPAQPLVSIIVPSFNQGRFIRQTLESILAQDYRLLEVIVIDGASTDETIDILHEFDRHSAVIWISEPDKGPVEAVNKGLARATGLYGAIQSSDDYYLPGAISAAVKAFQQAPAAGMVYGDYIKVDEAGVEMAAYRQLPYSLKKLLATLSAPLQPTVFFRLDMAKEQGGWDERLPYVPDTDLWIKLAFRAGAVKLERFLSCARSHPDQRDQHKAKILENYTSMLALSENLKTASTPVKLAAFSGLCQMKIRYGSNLTDARITQLYWQAILSYPPLAWSGKAPLHRLIPAYFPMTRLLSRLRKILLRKKPKDLTKVRK